MSVVDFRALGALPNWGEFLAYIAQAYSVFKIRMSGRYNLDRFGGFCQRILGL